VRGVGDHSNGALQPLRLHARSALTSAPRSSSPVHTLELLGIAALIGVVLLDQLPPARLNLLQRRRRRKSQHRPAVRNLRAGGERVSVQLVEDALSLLPSPAVPLLLLSCLLLALTLLFGLASALNLVPLIMLPFLLGPSGPQGNAELQLLLSSVRTSSTVFRGLDGTARLALYACACGPDCAPVGCVP
jgi:hypothetical protein